MGTRPPLLLPTMLQIYKEEELEVPEGVTVAVKARVITVTGPRGTLQKNAQHVAMSIRVIEQKVGPAKVKLVVWHGARKHVACLRTIRSQIENMITGVTYGFAYKMRLVYAHFPINVIIADDKKSVEIQLPRREARPPRAAPRRCHHLRVQVPEGRDRPRGQRRRHGVPVGCLDPRPDPRPQQGHPQVP